MKLKPNRIRVSFIGRKRGAIGITYTIFDILEVKDGFNGDALYDKYECISSLYVDGKAVKTDELKFSKL